MSTSNCSTSLFLAHAGDPYWSPASISPPPSVVVSSGPAHLTSSTSARIAFTADATGTPSVTCSLDGAAARPCSSPVSYSGLGDGSHTVRITATAAGVSGSATYSWQVDTAKPSVAITSAAPAGLASSTMPLSWRGSDADGIASWAVETDEAPYGGRFGGWSDISGRIAPATHRVTLSSMGAGRTICVRIKAVDNAGNAAYSAPRCVAIALDDRAMSGSGWARVRGTSYYLGTATSTSKHGAVLSRTGARLDRIGVVATTAPGSGTVGIYVAGRLVGSVNLASSRRAYRQVLMLPRFSARQGTVSVKVLSSGRPVSIDGLVVSQA